MIADAIPFGLHEFSGIAYAECVSANGYVEGDQMAHGGRVDEVGKDAVMVVIFQGKNFVVGLSEHGRKGDADERAGKVVCSLPLFSFYPKVVACFSCEVYHQVELTLSGVVAVAVVVDSASISGCGKPCGKVPLLDVSKMVEPGVAVTDATGIFFYILGRVLDVCGIDVNLCVVADVSVPQFGLAFCLMDDACFDAFVGVGGQVGIEYVGRTQSKERGAHTQRIDLSVCTGKEEC